MTEHLTDPRQELARLREELAALRRDQALLETAARANDNLFSNKLSDGENAVFLFDFFNMTVAYKLHAEPFRL